MRPKVNKLLFQVVEQNVKELREEQMQLKLQKKPRDNPACLSKLTLITNPDIVAGFSAELAYRVCKLSGRWKCCRYQRTYRPAVN